MTNRQHPGLALPEDIAQARQQELAAQQQAMQMRAQLGAEIYVGLITENVDVQELVEAEEGEGPSPEDLEKVAQFALNAATAFFTAAGLFRAVKPEAGQVIQ
jgi:DNA-binding protein H-NS